MEQTITKHDEEINKVVNQIVSNSKDAKWAKEMLTQLAGLYQMDKEIDIAVKDVTDTIDLGACVIKKCRQGYIFEAKGGLQTFVSWRMARVCAMLNTLFELYHKNDDSKEGTELRSAYISAIEMIFQCPIFSSLDERALFENAANIMRTFNEYSSEMFGNFEPEDESEQDLRDNAEFERQSRALEELADAPLPPEDKDNIG